MMSFFCKAQCIYLYYNFGKILFHSLKLFAAFEFDPNIAKFVYSRKTPITVIKVKL